MVVLRRAMRRRLWGAAALSAALIGGIVATVAVAGAGTPEPVPTSTATSAPRALSTDEAERLAVARFLAYQSGSTQFRTEVTAGGAPVALRGRVDHRAGVGIAAAELDGDTAIVTWNASTFVGWGGIAADPGIPAAPPAEPGAARPLDPSTSSVDAVLLLVLSLGMDRPENAQLLAQSDAAWLRADEIDGAPVDVIAGPSDADSAERNGGNTRFWIDSDGRLLRFEADLPSQTVTVDLTPEQGVPVPLAAQLAG
jgi:hypothetical protein